MSVDFAKMADYLNRFHLRGQVLLNAEAISNAALASGYVDTSAATATAQLEVGRLQTAAVTMNDALAKANEQLATANEKLAAAQTEHAALVKAITSAGVTIQKVE